MKKAFRLAVAILLLASIFPACKKDKAQTATQKVQHNWTLVSIVDNSHDASGDDIQTTNGISGDYMNFSSGGTVTFQITGQMGTSSYSMVNDTQILLATETYTIKILTNSQLVLYVKDVTSSTDYDEETINLKR